MTRRSGPGAAFALVVALVAVAGCDAGDEDDGAATTASAAAVTTLPGTTAPVTTTPVTTTPATTVPVTTVPATTEPATTAPATTTQMTEAEIAASALIRIDDFVDGWVETPRDDDDESDDRMIAMMSECAGVEADLIGDGLMGDTKAQSPDFESSDGTFSVDHTVGFAVDEATAAEAIVQIGDPDLPACYAEAIGASFAEAVANPDADDPLPPGLEIGEVTTEVVDTSDLGVGTEVIWFHVVVPLAFEDETVEQHGDVVFLRNGRVVSQVAFGGFGAAFPVVDIGPIVALAADRIATIA